MNRAELIALASPPCRDCGEPILRTETAWHLDEDGVWRLTATMVCPERHRVIVQAFA